MKITPQKIKTLGLTEDQAKIVLTLAKMGKKIALISRITGIPRTSILYMLEKLEERSIVMRVKNGKSIIWRIKRIP